MRVICSIAARAGSKGIPGKNLKTLGTRPLIAHAIEAALASTLVDKVIVNTEDEEIARVAESYGAEAPFFRKATLADDRTPLLMVTKDTMLQMDAIGYKADIIVQLAATCPFISSKTIDRSIEKSIESSCAVTLKQIEHEHPYRAKKLGENGVFSSFIEDIDVEAYQSRQDLPTLYCTSGGVYTRTRALLETATEKDFCLGEKPYGIVIDDIESVNIDRPIDFSFAEFLMKQKLNK